MPSKSLRSKRIWPLPGHGAFIPRSDQEEIVNVKTLPPRVQELVLESLKLAEAGISEYRKIIAILILIDKVAYLGAFIHCDITDNTLPISPNAWYRLRKIVQARSCEKKPDFATAFEDVQWLFLSPVFEDRREKSGRASPPHHVILDRAVPPFIAFERLNIVTTTSIIHSAQVHWSHLPCFRPPTVSTKTR